MQSKTTTHSVCRSRRRSVPTAPPDLPSVDDLRVRAVLGRVRSPALAAVIAGHCFGLGAETWRTAR
jgi:hypothetical protein